MKGILFRPDIWQAKLEVLETHGIAVTRRLIKPQPFTSLKSQWWCGKLYEFIKPDFDKLMPLYARYKVGDIVYIKEAWATEKKYDNLKPSEIPSAAYIHFVADGVGDYPLNVILGKWRPPMFLPERFARSHIKILDVQPQLFHFQDMTAEELELEGGEAAVGLLKGRYDGNYVWRIQFERQEKPQ